MQREEEREGEREGKRESQRERERQTGRQRYRQTDGQTNTEGVYGETCLLIVRQRDQEKKKRQTKEYCR